MQYYESDRMKTCYLKLKIDSNEHHMMFQNEENFVSFATVLYLKKKPLEQIPKGDIYLKCIAE